MHPKRNLCAPQQRRIRRQVQNSDAHTFFNLLTRPEMLGEVESLLPPYRERMFPPTEPLSMFLTQTLSADRSCQKAVNDTAVNRVARGLPRCSTHTGAYCRARQRVPMEMISTLVRQTGRRITAQAPAPWRWRGRPVRLVDGTTVVSRTRRPIKRPIHSRGVRSAAWGSPCAGWWVFCVWGAGQCSMRPSDAIRGRAVMNRPSSVRYSRRWSVGTCSSVMPFTPRIFCCAPCAN